MNKDKIQIGDLVTKDAYLDGSPRRSVRFGGWNHHGIGLAVDIRRPDLEEYALQVYWFKLGEARVEWSVSLTKLSPTQEEQNE